LDLLEIPGPGMHRLPLTTAPQAAPDDPGRVSRTIGALGADAWRRLCDLRVALVGCGRTGSMVAEDLARLGVRRFALVDPDLFEEHSLPESALFRDSDVGKPKALALALALRAMNPDLEVQTVVASVSSPGALATLRRYDAIVTAPDSDGARFAAAMIASLYHLVLLDVGVGVRRSGAVTTGGADVRLIVPGDHACLACYGGVRSLTGAISEITHPAPAVPWHQQRAGSSRALNRQATGVAVALLQDLVSERRSRSTWIRIDDTPAMHNMEPVRDRAACMCSRAGWADAAGL
jgi:molybdopterin/thiamine biosynthesis adenylyltransferase